MDWQMGHFPQMTRLSHLPSQEKHSEEVPPQFIYLPLNGISLGTQRSTVQGQCKIEEEGQTQS